MWRSIGLGIFAGIMCLPAFAQSTPNYDVALVLEGIQTCLDEAQSGDGEERACIGASVAACTEDAMTTVDMLGCIEPELIAWEERLNDTYYELLGVYQDQDADDDPARAVAPRLEQVQSTWTEWRNAKCGLEYDKFRGGSMGRLTRANCYLEETALRSLDLQSLLEEARL